MHTKNLEDEHATNQLINSKKKCFKCLYNKKTIKERNPILYCMNFPGI